MEPLYWYVGAYIVGTLMGFYFGRQSGIGLGILTTVATLIEGGYLKTRKLPDGELDIIQLTFEERIDDTANAETTDS